MLPAAATAVEPGFEMRGSSDGDEELSRAGSTRRQLGIFSCDGTGWIVRHVGVRGWSTIGAAVDAETEAGQTNDKLGRQERVRVRVAQRIPRGRATTRRCGG